VLRCAQRGFVRPQPRSYSIANRHEGRAHLCPECNKVQGRVTTRHILCRHCSDIAGLGKMVLSAPLVLPQNTSRLMGTGCVKPIGELPIFPDLRGKVVQVVHKYMMVKTYELMSLRTGGPLIGDMELNRFRCHSASGSGALYLANTDLELPQLYGLARWSSLVVMRYGGETPLTPTTSNCNRLLAGPQPHVDLRESVSRSPGVSVCLPDLCQVINEMIEPNVIGSQVTARSFNLYLLGSATRTAHRVHNPVLLELVRLLCYVDELAAGTLQLCMTLRYS
jgi:hypothetical protein